MSVQLWNYEAALLEMECFREANSLVLNTWEMMGRRLAEVTEALKEHARQNGPEEDERYMVVVRTFLDGLLPAKVVGIYEKRTVANPVTGTDPRD